DRLPLTADRLQLPPDRPQQRDIPAGTWREVLHSAGSLAVQLVCEVLGAEGKGVGAGPDAESNAGVQTDDGVGCGRQLVCGTGAMLAELVVNIRAHGPGAVRPAGEGAQAWWWH